MTKEPLRGLLPFSIIVQYISDQSNVFRIVL